MEHGAFSLRFRYVGLRFSTFIALWAASGGILGIGLMFAYGAWDEQRASVLEDELWERQAAADLAKSALSQVHTELTDFEARVWQAERKSAVHRATELVLFAALRARNPTQALPPSWNVGRGEFLGIVDRERDRLLGFASLLGTDTATLSGARPALADALTRRRDDAVPMVISEEHGVWAIGPSTGTSVYLAAYVSSSRPPSVSAEVLERAHRVLGHLSVPIPLGPLARSWWGVFLLGALVSGGAAFLWAHRRLSVPLDRTIEAARGFIHGVPTARAEAELGGREARELARTVNALIERAVRLEGQGRAARDEDIQSAARAIENLGQGNLRNEAPSLGPMFDPIAQAIEQARRDLLERVALLHDEACTVAKATISVEDSVLGIEENCRHQQEGLTHLREGVEASTGRVQRAAEELPAALEALKGSATEQRRVVQDVRATLATVERRVNDLAAGAARLSGLISSSAALDQALIGLSAFAAADESQHPEPARVSALVGGGRATLDAIERELGRLQEEMSDAAQILDRLAKSQPEPPPDALRSVSGPLYDGASSLVQAAELLTEGLQLLHRSIGSSREHAEHAHRSALEVGKRLPGLSAALSEIRLGRSFEEALLERLKDEHRELKNKAASTLSSDGQILMNEVAVAADAAAVRIDQLVEATESTLNILRE